MKPLGFVITFIAVVAGMVLFRSPTFDTAMNVLRGMVGLNGIAQPGSIVDHLGRFAGMFGRLNDVAISQDTFRALAKWIVLLGVVALAFPNTLQLLSSFEPALGVKPVSPQTKYAPKRLVAVAARLTWSPTLTWAIAVAVLAAIGAYHLGGNSEFLYWQF
jgi:hypothetical protein